MVADTPKAYALLLPDRHVQSDAFICDVADAVLKDVTPQMEHPFRSLSKKPETAVGRHGHNGHRVEIAPSVKGLATIFDKDILIYRIGRIMHALRDERAVSHRVRINTRAPLVFTNRGTAGKDCAALVEALDRLSGTRISRNIRTGDEERYDTFGLIDAALIRRRHGNDGRLLWCEVKLSDWVFDAIRAQEVLTLRRDYFRLREPIERRVHEIARKRCGRQATWSIGLDLLRKKSGPKSSLEEFRRSIRHLEEHGHPPDDTLAFRSDADIVVFANRGAMHEPTVAVEAPVVRLAPETMEDARALAPGWDVHPLRQERLNWMVDGGLDAPKNPDKAFLGSCRRWFERRGAP